MSYETTPGTREDIEALEFRCSMAAKTLADIDPANLESFFENFEFLRHSLESLRRSRLCAMSKEEQIHWRHKRACPAL